MPTPDPIERLRALLEAASPGPWAHDGEEEVVGVSGAPYAACLQAPAQASRDARAIAAWMNLRGEVMELLDVVEFLHGDGAGARSLDEEAWFAALNRMDDARDALRAAIEREVPDA